MFKVVRSNIQIARYTVQGHKGQGIGSKDVIRYREIMLPTSNLARCRSASSCNASRLPHIFRAANAAPARRKVSVHLSVKRVNCDKTEEKSVKIGWWERPLLGYLKFRVTLLERNGLF